MEFPNTPATKLTERIMAAISEHIKRDPPPQESHHYNRTYEKIYAILSEQDPKAVNPRRTE